MTFINFRFPIIKTSLRIYDGAGFFINPSVNTMVSNSQKGKTFLSLDSFCEVAGGNMILVSYLAPDESFTVAGIF